MFIANKISYDFEYFLIDKKSTKSRHEVYRLWYNVYFKEMKRNLKYADHINKVLIDPLEPHSHIILAKHYNKLVGTFRINLPEDCELDYYNDLYQLKDFKNNEIAIGTRYMILPDYRGNYISHELMNSAIQVLKDMGKKLLIIDCNPPVYNLFKKLGFTSYLEEKTSHEFGKVHIMKYEI
jgi:predicted GNAT family N-acyltransferase